MRRSTKEGYAICMACIAAIIVIAVVAGFVLQDKMSGEEMYSTEQAATDEQYVSVALEEAVKPVDACGEIACQEDTAPDTYDTVDEIAKTVYGEAKGCDKTEMAAVVWCILNRSDAWGEDPLSVVQKPGQFCGYSYCNPVVPEIREIVEDVMARHDIESRCVGGVGRVLPKSYLYFTGDGYAHNFFRERYTGGNVWDWSLPSPYEGGVAEWQ